MLTTNRIIPAFLVIAIGFAAGCSGRERHFVFTYDVIIQNPPTSAKVVDIWIPIPPTTPQQRIIDVRFDAPGQGIVGVDPTYGNRIWHLRMARPKEGRIRITQTVEVERREQTTQRSLGAKSLTSDQHARFLSPSRLVPDSPRFAALATEQTRGRSSGIETARALYDYVLHRMTYDKSGKGWGHGDALLACEVGKGNCTDFHSLFIALARSIHIPARFLIGFPIPPAHGNGTVGGYHCWGEFWVPAYGWVPVDISEADKHPDKAGYFFGNLDEDRIAYTIGRDIVLPSKTAGPPRNFLVYAHVEVDGATWDNVEHAFTYRDIE